MWYLITFEVKGFVTLTGEPANTKFRYADNEGDKHVVTVTGGEKNYRAQLTDDNAVEYYGEILNDLQSISPGNFIVINFSTILIKWEDSLSTLNEKVSEYMFEDCNFVILPVTGKAASNMPQGFLMAINHALK